MACHFLLLKLVCKSGFSRAVTAQIKKKLLLFPTSSSLKAMGRIKLSAHLWPHSCRAGDQHSCFRGEAGTLSQAGADLSYAREMTEHNLILQLPSPSSHCVVWAEGKKRKMQGWQSSSSATDLLFCPQARYLILHPPCSVASGMGCIQPKGFTREILSTHSSLGLCLALLMLSTSQSSQKWGEDRSGAWSPL